ncbi:hypothetical protein GOZ80_08365 [Agrobacterium vitis]|uniref:Uncharacterized protein n=1 Tax=Agrobacterium vitis TaxID=373 RepID=A0A109CNA3_AGRVI|nr:hypothetical protein [Agrobacterium vitis]KAA3513711.1 hypothetical protein DXM22_14865 [Agrobacterium vitis]KAA3528292.1 hypothetical protein DXT89_09690 [Agrobacterium vitis]MCM2449051.1 hypothetical protein [Agrobacterium vitis]MCM2467313.1 hypothetical protein [Agrobacterium vitis]MUO68782.1 hypothetical protein [Agrobacterium vitis]
MPKYVTRPAAESYGYAIGILAIDGGEPGDVGNPSSYSYPVLYRSLHPGDVAEEDLVIGLARELFACGVRAIGGTGGSLFRHQRAVAAAVDIPVCLSPVACMPMVAATFLPSVQ